MVPVGRSAVCIHTAEGYGVVSMVQRRLQCNTCAHSHNSCSHVTAVSSLLMSEDSASIRSLAVTCIGNSIANTQPILSLSKHKISFTISPNVADAIKTPLQQRFNMQNGECCLAPTELTQCRQCHNAVWSTEIIQERRSNVILTTAVLPAVGM